jgi:hypothetical protein
MLGQEVFGFLPKALHDSCSRFCSGECSGLAGPCLHAVYIAGLLTKFSHPRSEAALNRIGRWRRAFRVGSG